MTPHPKFDLRVLAERPDGSALKASHLSFMDPEIVYSLCMLRQDVFIIEQGVSSEQELDGLDREDSTITVWWEKDGDVIGTIRVFPGEGCMRIGRLACAKSARRGGYGGALMAAAIDLCKERESTQKIVIHGQSYLKDWYESLGYVTVSDEFYEAGIAHYTMEYHHP